MGLFILPTEVENSRWLKVEGDFETIWSHVSTADGWEKWNSNEQALKDEGWLSGGKIKVSDSNPKKWTVQYVIEDALDSGTLQLQPLPEDKGAWVKWNHISKTGYSPMVRLKHLSKKQKGALSMDRALKRLSTLIQNDAAKQTEND